MRPKCVDLKFREVEIRRAQYTHPKVNGNRPHINPLQNSRIHIQNKDTASQRFRKVILIIKQGLKTITFSIYTI